MYALSTPRGKHNVQCIVGRSKPILMLIDSGSDWNLVSEKDWKQLQAAWRAGTVVLHGMTEKPGDSAKAYASSEALQALRTFHAWVEVPEAR